MMLSNLVAIRTKVCRVNYRNWRNAMRTIKHNEYDIKYTLVDTVDSTYKPYGV